MMHEEWEQAYFTPNIFSPHKIVYPKKIFETPNSFLNHNKFGHPQISDLKKSVASKIEWPLQINDHQ